MKDELEKRVQQFNSLSLPGQPRVMHMGTSYLVNDLWREVQRCQRIEAAARGIADDIESLMGLVGGTIDQHNNLEEFAAALKES